MTVTALPGTTVELPGAGYPVRQLLSSIFLPGGLVLSQVAGLTGLSPHMLQNWVKRGFLPRPVNKKYTIMQFSRVAIINALKDSQQIEQIVNLIGYVVGRPANGAGALTDETSLYCDFVEVLLRADFSLENLEPALSGVLSGYREPYAGARQKVADVLRVMCTLYISSRIKQSAELMIGTFNL